MTINVEDLVVNEGENKEVKSFKPQDLKYFTKIPKKLYKETTGYIQYTNKSSPEPYYILDLITGLCCEKHLFESPMHHADFNLTKKIKIIVEELPLDENE